MQPLVKSQYFRRSMPWSVGDDKRLIVHDSITEHAPRMVTLDPWHQLIFSAADGVHTIQEFMDSVAADYEDGVPPGFEEQVVGLVHILCDERLIELTDEPRPLPVYLSEDYLMEKPELRKQQMRDDGYLP